MLRAMQEKWWDMMAPKMPDYLETGEYEDWLYAKAIYWSRTLRQWIVWEYDHYGNGTDTHIQSFTYHEDRP